MRFTLTIDCDNAAFQPVHDDASEPERYRAANYEIGRILAAVVGTCAAAHLTSAPERSGFLRDSNGNRCGQWSLSDDESEG